MRKEVNSKNNEEGLLSICFDPKYADNGFVYLYYSATNPRRSILSQFRASDDRKTINMDSEKKFWKLNSHIQTTTAAPFFLVLTQCCISA